jgi:hypothetical protein
MAYPTVDAPYGLQPINRFDGMPYAGATQQLPIASTYNTAIFNGDLVYVTSGTIAKSVVTSNVATAANTVTYGVFVGVQYVNAQGQTVQAQYYPGNAAATSAIAYVVVDPVAEFKTAVTFSGNATVTTVNGSIVGANMEVRQGSGSTLNGDSGISAVVPATGTGNATTLPLRAVAVVPETATNATAFTEVIVKLNNPQILSTTGNNYTA